MTFPLFGFLERPYRHAQRYRQILKVLFKYGFADLVESLGLETFLEISLKKLAGDRKERIDSLTRAQRVRLTLEELGPTFIKFGQILSTRSDLLPAEFVLELEKLQDEVPPFSFEEVRKIIEEELENPLDRIFPEFDERPIASASLGQVHRARLPSGETMAVKVQRPGIPETIETDMEILLHLATLLENHVSDMKLYRPTRIVREMTYTVEQELDYTIEASHIRRFARQMANEPGLYVPRVYEHLTTPRVLTMEYVFGIRAGDEEALSKNGLDRKILADTLSRLIMKQVFEHGFFHADLHPGNIFFLPQNVICFLDFGMMGRLDRRSREDFADLVIAIANRDEAAACRALLRLTYLDPEDEDPDLRVLQRDVADFMDLHFYRPLKELDLGKLLQNMLHMVSRHRLRFPPNLFMMLRSMTTVEGLSKTLDPDFDLVERAEPFVRRVRLHKYSPGRLSEEAGALGLDFLELFRELPGDLRDLLTEAKRGNLRLDFKHRGLNPLVDTYDRASKRVAFSVVLAALIVGSALIVLSGVPPKLFGLPLIGIAGFLFAGVLGMWLMISILRRGGM